jgi:hypothetical protein
MVLYLVGHGFQMMEIDLGIFWGPNHLVEVGVLNANGFLQMALVVRQGVMDIGK